MKSQKVFLPYKWSTGYTYNGDVKYGAIVKVSIKNRIVLGLALGEGEQVTEVKNILDVIPFHLEKAFINFLHKASEYNMLFFGEVLSMVIREWEKVSSWYLWKNTIYSITQLVSDIGKRKFNTLTKQGEIIPIELDESKMIQLYKDNIKLTQEQNSCLKGIILDKPVLLKGATGSGKTNIYLKIISNYLNKQCIILLPEISLTEEFTSKIFELFGFWPHIWHHRIDSKVKNIVWSWAISGQPGIILGSRSALWLPFTNLGCIVVDEEHDDAFKQDQSPRYNCRDMAVLRAYFEKCPIILVSATPSLESWNNTLKGKYRLAELEGCLGSNSIIVKRQFGEWLSAEAKYAMIDTLNTGGQVLLFLNRRGFASNLFCTSCGNVLLCKHCSASLIIYKNLTTKCSYCDYSSHIENCKTCGSKAWKMHGLGIEKVFDQLKIMFPNVQISTLSSDDKTIKKQIQSIHDNETKIVVATQILSKGHHFANLRLIVILQADHGLSSGDPRNTERIYQLLTQVKGRFGSKDSKNLAIIQTSNPESNLMKSIAQNNFIAWVKEELKIREKHNLPPFYFLIRIIVSSHNFENSYNDAYYLYNEISKLKNIKVYKPAPTELYKYKGSIRNYIIIHYKQEHPQEDLFKIITLIKLPNKSEIKADVDPRNFF